MPTIAIVEPLEAVRRRLARIVSADGFEIVESADALEALRAAFQSPPVAVIMGTRLAGLGGVDFIKVLRATWNVPIVVTMELQEPREVAQALDAGADDVVGSSCSPVELLARLRGAMRRYVGREPGGSQTRVVTGALDIDLDARMVAKRGTAISLSRIEYRLLSALARRLGETVTHRELLTDTWGHEYADDAHYLRLYVAYLRAKLEDDVSRPVYILNEWGRGYRLARLAVEHPASPTPRPLEAEDLVLAAG